MFFWICKYFHSRINSSDVKTAHCWWSLYSFVLTLCFTCLFFVVVVDNVNIVVTWDSAQVKTTQCYSPHSIKISSSLMAQQKQALTSGQFRSFEVKEIHSAPSLTTVKFFKSSLQSFTFWMSWRVVAFSLLLWTTGWFVFLLFLLIKSKPRLTNQPH